MAEDVENIFIQFDNHNSWLENLADQLMTLPDSTEFHEWKMMAQDLKVIFNFAIS